MKFHIDGYMKFDTNAFKKNDYYESYTNTCIEWFMKRKEIVNYKTKLHKYIWTCIEKMLFTFNLNVAWSHVLNFHIMGRYAISWFTFAKLIFSILKLNILHKWICQKRIWFSGFDESWWSISWRHVSKVCLCLTHFITILETIIKIQKSMTSVLSSI